jgi:hypothetical protein
MVIVDVAVWSKVTEAGVEDVIVMSGVWNVKDALVWGAREPPLAVIVTMKVPSLLDEHETVAVTGVEVRVNVVGLITEQVNPLGKGASVI